MAIFGPFKNPSVKINGTELGTEMTNVVISTGDEQYDKTTFGSNTRISGAALKTWSISGNLLTDFAAGQGFWTVENSRGQEVLLLVKPDTGATTSGNPLFSGVGVLGDSQDGGDVGSRMEKPFTYNAAGDLSILTA